MMKYFWGAAIVFIMIGLPIGSYLYLQAGYKYRLNTLHELKPKDDFITFLSSSNTEVNKNVADRLRKNLSVVHLVDQRTSDHEMNQLAKLWEQYRIRENFRIIHLIDTATVIPGVGEIAIDSTVLKMNFSKDIAGDTTNPLILIGSEGKVRGSYNFEDLRFKKLVEHIPVLIPIPEHQKIKLKRDL